MITEGQFDKIVDILDSCLNSHYLFGRFETHKYLEESTELYNELVHYLEELVGSD